LQLWKFQITGFINLNMENIKEIVPTNLQEYFKENNWIETEGLYYIKYVKGFVTEAIEYYLEVQFSCVDGMNCLDFSLVKGFMKFRLNHDYSQMVHPDWESFIDTLYRSIAAINEEVS
jgi:hypothetical protein